MTLSIGTVGDIAFDKDGDRSKGILEKIAKNENHLEHLLNSCAEQARDGTRLAVRIPIGWQDTATLKRISVPWKNGLLRLEGFIPIWRDGIAGLAYYGANDPARPGHDAGVEQQELALLEDARARPPKERLLPDGYVVDVLSRHPSTSDVERLVWLYRECYSGFMTTLDDAMIREMCDQNTVVVARNAHGEIAAVVQGETVTISSIGLRLVERSDMATDPNQQGLGLSTACCHVLFAEVERRDTLVYAESRHNWLAVLIENFRLGMLPAGRLPLHTRIDSRYWSVPQVGPFGNLAPFYRPMI